jgi:hypothetical protein
MKAARLMASGSWFISNANTSRKGIENNPSTAVFKNATAGEASTRGVISISKSFAAVSNILVFLQEQDEFDIVFRSYYALHHRVE